MEKLATMIYCTLSNQQPTYLVNLLHFPDMPRALRSYCFQKVFVPKTKLTIGKRAFSVAVELAWGSRLRGL